MSSQITTITFFRFKGWKAKLWGFGSMQYMRKPLARIPGQQFYKLMGTGKKNFNPRPDWEVYTVLQVWDHESAANDFFSNSQIIRQYQQNAAECWTIYLKNITVKGTWGAQNPFEISENLDPGNQYIAAITRATIKTSKLRTFWKFVPTSRSGLENNTGLLYTKGIGEIPIKNMATFSIWQNLEALQKYAYSKQGNHRKAITKTHEIQWYSEELFSRFQPYKSVGSWGKV